MTTATDITRAHYMRSEVRKIIERFAMPGDGWRALNGDFHRWYKNFDGRARLLTIDDFEEIISEHRTLYQTLNVFDKSLWMVDRSKNEITSENPLGTTTDTMAYTLSVDIDKGHGFAIEDTKDAVEAAAQFLVDYLKKNGVYASVWVLFSGGGIYVQIHHEICKPRHNRTGFFELVLNRYNRLIDHVSAEFFKTHPEYIGKVKYDALNNSKRVFKCILSVHKKKPYAVVPLNRDAIAIDFERARVPLQEGVIADARTWYSTYDPAEREALLKLLDQFADETEGTKQQSYEIWRSPTKIDAKYFPPCIRHIIDAANTGTGKTRFSGVLAAFLYHMGWSDEEAWELVKSVSARNGLANASHIFDSCFGRINCPSCSKIRNDGAGYPHLGLKGLGCCKPEKDCDRWAGNYAIAMADRDHNKKIIEELIKTILSDPRNLKNPDVVQVLAALKANDPIEYELVLNSIKKGGTGIKVDTINQMVDKHIGDNKQKNEESEKPSEDDIKTARDILENGDPIAAHMKYVNRKIRGREKPARAVTMSAYSTYMSPDDRLHADAVGSSQSGKTATVIATLETFPEENVIVASEASPKSLYYLARENPERLKNAIVYIDDGRPEHIPVLKTFRNEGNVTPRNMSVIDGEFMELTVQYRPVVMSSSVTPLRDMEQQATSRNFLIPIPDATDEEEKDIRTTIRKQARAGAVLSNGDDDERRILQTMARILRDDESVKDVLIPFDVVEPQGADRRGTGQFMRFIKISAFINQFQRPILELTDGRKFVLATYDDFVTAATVWFDFAAGQEFKISTAALVVLKALPDEWPGRSAPNLVKIVGKSQRTIERYLEDLYESGVANRERISAPGMPWGYWCEPETRQRVLSRISDTADTAGNSDRITTKNPCREYLGKKSSDSLIDSSKEFFNNNDIVKKEMYRSITYRQRTLVGDFGEIYLSLSNFPGIHVVIRKMRRMIANIIDKTFLARFDRIRQIAFRFCRDYCREYENPTSPSGIPDKSAHGSDSIQTEVEEAQRRLEETEAHYSKRAKKYKIGSYREMVALVPYDKSSPEAEKICRAFRGQLTKGMAPRLEFIAKDTDLPKETIESYLNNAPWVRKDISQGGIMVYLPVKV